jgi:hypothetical protein
VLLLGLVEATTPAPSGGPATVGTGRFRSLGHTTSGRVAVLEWDRFDDEFLSLGRLKANQGNQNYEIAAELDPAR